MKTYTDRIEAIINAKYEAGSAAYLWLHSSGDCILWRNEDQAKDDNGRDALARWELTPAEVDELIATGEVDEIA